MPRVYFQVTSHDIGEVRWKKTVPFCQLKRKCPLLFLGTKNVLAQKTVSSVGAV